MAAIKSFEEAILENGVHVGNFSSGPVNNPSECKSFKPSFVSIDAVNQYFYPSILPSFPEAVILDDLKLSKI